MALKVGGLFAGYGGIELALSSVLDVEPAWFCEFDKAPSKILAHHWLTVPNFGDVTAVDWSAVEPVDIITGGSPCQDLSHAGKRAGMKAGTRSGLWASMCDAIDIIRPRLVIWENVRGALSAEATSAVEPCPLCVGDDPGTTLRALGRVLGDLAELGYDARWYGLRAADVGAAHGRFRVFLFATPRDAEGFGVEGLGARGQQVASAHAGQGVSVGSGVDAPISGQLTLLGTPRCADGMQHDLRESVDNPRGRLEDQVSLLPTPRATRGGSSSETRDLLLPTPRATDGTKGGPNQRGSSGDLMLPSAVAQLLPTPTTQPMTGNGHARNLGKEAKMLPTPTSQAAKHAGGDTDRGPGTPDDANLWIVAQRQDWREYEAAIRRQEHAFGRPAPLPTEPGKNGQPRLSPAFVEWLMGLPAGHVTNPAIGISRNDQLKALGNGVVPQQCAAALRAFLTDITKEVAA